MAKGKSTFVELRCPKTGRRLATRTINKSHMKASDLTQYKVYSPGAKERVNPLVKEISRAKKN